MIDLYPNDEASTPKKRGRPKIDPDQSETRRKLIRAGLVHLTEKGYSSVGVDEILHAAGVPKGSFYHYFANKADFGLQLVDAYNRFFLAKLDKAFEQRDLSPLDRLRAFTRDAEAGMAHYDFRRGCLVGNLGQEMGALPEGFRARLIEVLEEWQARTADCLSEAQADGALGPDRNVEELALFFWTGWEGAVLRAKLEKGPEPLRRFTTTFFDLLAE